MTIYHHDVSLIFIRLFPSIEYIFTLIYLLFDINNLI